MHLNIAVCGWYAILMGKRFSRYGMNGTLHIFRGAISNNLLDNGKIILSLDAPQKAGGITKDWYAMLLNCTSREECSSRGAK